MIRAIAWILIVLTPVSMASAQNLNNSIADYSPDAFKNCYAGTDIGAMLGVSNPLLLLGSIAYIGPVMKDGAVGQGWVREPLSLPITITEAVDPDVTTCSLELEATTTGSLNFLGLGVNAERADVYRVNVRLISRQQLAQIPENGTQVRVWNSQSYLSQFRSAIGGVQANIDNFWLFDNISVYLIQVERFRRRSGNITAGIGLFSSGFKYSRDGTFRGTRILVAGDPVPLTRSRYLVTPPSVAAAPATYVPVAIGEVLSPEDVEQITSALNETKVELDR